MKRTILTTLVVAALAQGAWAQSGTNSPYSQFGLGLLTDQTSGFNRGMNGLGYGFHEHNQVNFQNPASYASLDSLTFIFDVGLSGQVTNFKEGSKKLNANNADFEYAVAGLRLMRHVGLGFGIVPFTTVGYSHSSTMDVNDANKTTMTNTYKGSGGLHQVFLGLGWEPFRGFSVGVNGSYLYGDYSRSVVSSFSDTYANTLTKLYSAEVQNYRLDFGLQYTQQLTKKDAVTLGLTYSYGHKIGGEPKLNLISTNAQTSVSDTLTLPRNGKLQLELPHSFGGGLMWNHNNSVKVGVDYSLMRWSVVHGPEYVASNAAGEADYHMASNLYKDRHKFTLGAQICPDERGQSLLKRIQYRAGVSYATPYYYINGSDGPKELSASIGFGIPIRNSYNNRSILNISGQWVRQDAKNFITENTFRINIGLTFNERWFAKWKVD